MIIPCTKNKEELIKKLLEDNSIVKIKTWNGDMSIFDLKIYLDNGKIITLKTKEGLNMEIK